ncbi:Wzz/FepE/Etk N-terminal domain-containing protein [Vibrio parahaemolyticus]|uniref:Wzz/FepE/Etk N-terminal domain-containing protein n=3 Tax=Vibrio parahaemolyticus TaxID=670 RepID=UPI001037BBA3|nr:Wzz/FepE/Etk N-terminal domain-containing protein [Vibrio parahaemolyticus]EJG1064233.1 LPS O-antigen length regulator [Vibrio parahaemolyticus O1]EGR2041897.1 LPS O-antigen length regulator [Vibrio parahaemolyticus]EHK2921042.1 LPS O-antigen length regulator [Vibrio parahaemolyticus]EIV8504074.1 LPS O-antigen length regulator [Vibrio parahaemolyticus]EIZ1045673.1 LPS O-antigen length regulator [Vibrio parahaemolyticus]
MNMNQDKHPQVALPRSRFDLNDDLNQSVDIREILKAIYSGKLYITFVTIAFCILSVFFALSRPDIYQADALLSPAENSSSGGLSQMAGQFGGIAALAGVNLNAGKSSQTELAVQVMQSRKFIESFISKHDLLIPIMAVNSWDIGSGSLNIDADIYNEDTKEWLRDSKGLRAAKPSTLEAYEIFIKDIFQVAQDKDSGLYRITVNYYSPYVAKEWVDWLVADINEVMRNRTIEETTKNLKYLSDQLVKTPITEMQSTFYKLIEEQTKSLMLAEAQEEFVFKVVDPSVVPELKSKPKRSLIVIIGTFMGFMFGLALVLIRYAVVKNRAESSEINQDNY